MPVEPLSIIGLIIGSATSYFGWNEWRKHKAIENTPRSTVRSIAMGRTELNGTITSDNALQAPLSGNDCVAYTYKVEQEHHDDDGSDWHTIKHGEQATTATLTDDTGSVAVDLNSVTIESGHEFYEETHSFDDPSDDFKERLNDLDVNWEGLLGNHNMRYHETRIETNDDVYLLGTARDNPDVDDTTATANQDDILITKDNDIFLISNDDEASLRSTTAWRAGGLILLGVTFLIASLTYLTT